MSAESLSATIQVPYRPNVSYYNNLSPAQRDREATEEKRKGTSFSVLGIWTGEDEKFAYVSAIWCNQSMEGGKKDSNVCRNELCRGLLK